MPFYLSPNFEALAKAGSNDEGSEHEYYVTAESEWSQPKIVSSANFNIANQIKPPQMDVVSSLHTVEMPDEGEEQEKKICVCKENNFYWSSKLTCDQRKKVLQVCANIWGEDKKKDKASELMAIIHLETGGTFSPSKENEKGYVGLVQFGKKTAESLGTTYDDLKNMTFVKQMDYVEKYLKTNKDKMKTLVDFYLQVLKPNAVGNGDNPDYVVFDESISVPDGDGSKTSKEQREINIQREPWVTKYGYASNPTFMKGDEYTLRSKWVYLGQRYKNRYGYHDGKTTIKEIDEVVREEHYQPGASQLFVGECKNVVVKKEEKTNNALPPWVELAIKEEKKTIRETTHCQYIIDTYHASTDNYKIKKCSGNRSEAAWCAAFVNYCLENTGYNSQQDPGAIWYKEIKRVMRGTDGPYFTEEIWAKKHIQMYIGGVVVWHNANSSDIDHPIPI